MKRDLPKVIAALLMASTAGCLAGLPAIPPDELDDAATPDVQRPVDRSDAARADTPVVTPPDARADVGVGVDASADTPAPPPPPPPADAGPLPPTEQMVPTFDSATVAHVREVRARGVAMGVRANTFAKIGDSITEAASFLQDIGYGWFNLGAWGALEPTIQYFRVFTFEPEVNSFNHGSLCAMGGWVSSYALAGAPDSALRRELDFSRPAYALLMYGTNDLDRYDTATFRGHMDQIVDYIEGRGAVVAISTIPDRLDRPDAMARVAPYNTAIRAMATQRHLPLMEYWGALQPLPNRGVDTDGIHPNLYRVMGTSSPGTLTPAGLQYGYNMRNLVAIVMLNRLLAVR